MGMGYNCMLPNLVASEFSFCVLFMANICCSIELEPRTLRQGQLSHAREAAADVVQKLEPHEASTLFVEELRPVDCTMKKMEQIIEVVVECKETGELVEIPCQCSCIDNTSTSTTTTTINFVESSVQDQDDHKLKEPLSAPF